MVGAWTGLLGATALGSMIFNFFLYGSASPDGSGVTFLARISPSSKWTFISPPAVWPPMIGLYDGVVGRSALTAGGYSYSSPRYSESLSLYDSVDSSSLVPSPLLPPLLPLLPPLLPLLLPIRSPPPPALPPLLRVPHRPPLHLGRHPPPRRPEPFRYCDPGGAGQTQEN